MTPDPEKWGAFVVAASKQELLEIERSSRYEDVLPWEEYCNARFHNERKRITTGRRLGLSWCNVFYLLLLLPRIPPPTINNYMIDDEQAHSTIP